jgi:hypothetical protein
MRKTPILRHLPHGVIGRADQVDTVLKVPETQQFRSIKSPTEVFFANPKGCLV